MPYSYFLKKLKTVGLKYQFIHISSGIISFRKLNLVHSLTSHNHFEIRLSNKMEEQ